MRAASSGRACDSHTLGGYAEEGAGSGGTSFLPSSL